MCSMVHAARRRPPAGWRLQRRQDAGAGGRDGDGVLDVGGPAAVGGAHGPAVVVDQVAVPAARQQHRLEGDDETGLQPWAGAGATLVRDVGLLVHLPPDAMATMVLEHPVAASTGRASDGVGDVAEAEAGAGGGDA